MTKISRRTQELLKADSKHVLHPACIVGENSGLVIEKAHGIYLVDTEGKKYVDMASGNCCCNLGHGRREIIAAVISAISMTDFSTLFYGHSNTFIIECARKLARLTPGDLDHFCFTNSGSEAVDSAIKIARLYWHNDGRAGKYKIISLYDSYHGVSGFSTWVTGTGLGTLQDAFGPPPPGLIRIPSYYCYRCTLGLNYPECGTRCAWLLEDIICSEGTESVAAFIAEPMLGGGGFIEPPPEWWPIIAGICRKYDVLLIADEVISGFARTGTMFAVEHWKITPEMMTMAKGITGAYLPFGAVAVNDRIYDRLRGKLFTHGFTYSGHAIPAAASSAALDIYVREKVPENAARVGSHIRKRLDAEFAPLPCVGNIGGMGINFAVELVSDRTARTPITPRVKTGLLGKLLEQGIYTRCVGRFGNRLHIGPPCTMTVEEADAALDIILPLLAGLK